MDFRDTGSMLKRKEKYIQSASLLNFNKVLYLEENVRSVYKRVIQCIDNYIMLIIPNEEWLIGRPKVLFTSKDICDRYNNNNIITTLLSPLSGSV